MKPTLIIVDDAQMIRAQLRRILEKDFDIVAEAENGHTALELVHEHRPELVVMDVVMPRMSGIEATRILMSGPKPHSKIVIVSGMKEETIVLQALEAGACDYLFKPIEGEKLRQVLLGFSKSAA